MNELITNHVDSNKHVNVTVHRSAFSNGEKKYALVNRNTASLENLIAVVHQNNPLLSESVIRMVATEFKIAIQQKLKAGEAVNVFDMGTLYLTAKGGIDSQEPTSGDIPQLGVAFTPSKTAKESVVNIEIDTAVMADTNPAIGTFTDLSTNITGFEMTQNMPMKITGDRLKIIGDSQFAGIYFAPVLESGKINSDETAWIKVDKIFKNSPKELSFIIPSHLVPDSNYFVIIRTFGGRGNKANKTLKSSIGTNPVKINVA